MSCKFILIWQIPVCADNCNMNKRDEIFHYYSYFHSSIGYRFDAIQRQSEECAIRKKAQEQKNKIIIKKINKYWKEMRWSNEIFFFSCLK